MAMTSMFGHASNSGTGLPFRGLDRQGELVTIREAVVNDAVEYLAHMRRIVGETEFMLQCAYDPLPPVDVQRRLLGQLECSDNSIGLVAYRPNSDRGSHIVGSLTLLGGRSLRTRHNCTLGMGIDRSAWGRGLGGMLLDAAVAWARASPVLTRMGLQVFDDNHSALALYLGRGFEDEGTMQREVVVDGTSHHLVGMGLQV